MVYVPKALTYFHRHTGTSLTNNKLRYALSKLQLLEKHVQLNRARGKQDFVSVLRQRQYHFVKLVLQSGLNTRELQRPYGLCVDRMLWRFGLSRAFYLLYLQYVKSRRQHS